MLPTDTTPILPFAFTKLSETFVVPIVKSAIAFVPAVVDDAPSATSPVEMLAVAPLPSAKELSFPAVVVWPNAAAFVAVAFALLPIATA